MGSSQGKKLPPDTLSFTDCKPGVNKYDVKHTHVWAIGDISKKMEMTHGTGRLRSGVFSIKTGDQTIDWCLAIYPNGEPNYDESIGHIGIYLVKITATELPISAVHFTVSLGDNNLLKNARNSDTIVFSPVDTSGGVRGGWNKFLSHSDLRKPANLIPDDILTVMCEITIKEGGVTHVGSMSQHNKNKDASARKCLEDLGNVFSAGKFPDVTISCQGKQFPCHKAILAGRSTVFEAMFTHNMKESLENEVLVEDIGADTCEEMLFFIYSGKVKNLKENAVNLLAAGEKYDLKELKQECEESLYLNLEVDNVIDVLVAAYHHNASNLQTRAMKFIGKNAKIVAAQKEWREKIRMYPEMMADVMDVIIQK